VFAVINTNATFHHTHSILPQTPGDLRKNTHTVSQKHVTTLIMNNFYKLEPIVRIFGILYAETTGF